MGLISELRPDVVLLDISSPKIGGIEVIASIKHESPDTKPLMLSAARDEAMIMEGLKAGAKGYLSKDATASDLFRAIHALYEGDVWIERKLIAKFIDGVAIADFQTQRPKDRAKEGLTPREREVLRCLTKGWTNKEIAGDLFISEKTVKSHLNNIFKKLNVSRRLQAILYAIERGLK
jgi:DNA-binding NarL/FixJ family response regulator